MNTRTTAKKYVEILMANTDEMLSGKISHLTFSARQQVLWREIEASPRKCAKVHRLLRDATKAAT